jgi:hypothetical protein
MKQHNNFYLKLCSIIMALLLVTIPLYTLATSNKSTNTNTQT